MRKIAGSIFLALGIFFAGVAGVLAIADHVEISDLPAYTKEDHFDLSYSAFSEGGVNVKFFYRKDGSSYTQFGPTLGTPSGTVGVTSSQLNEDQVKYFFKVELNGATSDETSVTLDRSGPSPVSDYSKEVLSSTHVKLHWRNPNDSDFWKVVIYRSTSSEFTADDNTKVAEIVGPRDAVMQWEDAGQEAGKTYYYAIRAVDSAGNGSSLVSDVDAQVLGTSTGESSVGGEEIVTILPSDGTGGSILGEGDEAMMEDGEAGTQDQEVSLEGDEDAQSDAGSSTVRRVLTVTGILVLLYAAYRFFFRKRN